MRDALAAGRRAGHFRVGVGPVASAVNREAPECVVGWRACERDADRSDAMERGNAVELEAYGTARAGEPGEIGGRRVRSETKTPEAAEVAVGPTTTITLAREKIASGVLDHDVSEAKVAGGS